MHVVLFCVCHKTFVQKRVSYFHSCVFLELYTWFSECQICRLTFSCDSITGICMLCCSVFVTRHLLKSVSVIFIHVYFRNYTLNCLLCGTLLELYTYIS